MKENDPYEMPGEQPKVPGWVMTLLSPILYPLGWVAGRLKEREAKKTK